jgi:hypothetical protein
MKKANLKSEKVFFFSISLLIIVLFAFLGVLLNQGVVIQKKIIDVNLTAAIGAMLGGIFGPLVSIVAVYFYYQALRQDKEQFENKIYLEIYQELYAEIETIDRFFDKRNCKYFTSLTSLVRYKKVQSNIIITGNAVNDSKAITEAWKEHGDLRKDIEKDYQSLKENVEFLREHILRFKCLHVRVSDPEIRIYITVLKNFYEKLLSAIDNHISIGFEKGVEDGYLKLRLNVLQKIENELLMGVDPSLSGDLIRKMSEELSLQ